MIRLLKYFPNWLIAYLAVIGLMVGLVTSKVVLSVATITIFCNAFINVDAGKNIRNWLNDKTNLVLLAVFVLYLITGFYSDNSAEWLDRCRTKLPFLALPLGFASMPALNKRKLYAFLSLYILIMFISAIAVTINYFNNYSEMTQLIKLGNAIPTPQNDHIRFSIEVAFACILAFHLFMERFIFKYPVERWIFFVIGIILFIILHILAVRSGLFVLYVVMLFAFAKRMLEKRNFKQSAIIISSILFMAFASVQLIPSLNNKVSYFLYEWSLIKNGELKPGHSDAQRLVSTKFGFQVGKEHLLFGVGVGDIKETISTKYEEAYGDEKITYKLPHNQYVFVFASTGLFGVIIFFIALIYPFIEKQRYKEFHFLAFALVVVLSCLSEHMLEIQIGTAFYLTFLLLFINYQKTKSLQTAHA